MLYTLVHRAECLWLSLDPIISQLTRLLIKFILDSVNKETGTSANLPLGSLHLPILAVACLCLSLAKVACPWSNEMAGRCAKT